MRILGGEFKGRQILAGKDLSIRPTTNRIKNTIFNLLDNFCYDIDVLDMFCGTGSLGIEALSRGAREVTFIDKFESSLKILKNNITRLNIDPAKFTIVKEDAIEFCKHIRRSYKLIILDPPFRYRMLQNLIDLIIKRCILSPAGILLIHHEITNQVQPKHEKYDIIKQKKIGRSIISFIINEEKNVT